jgi:hypothetical protein
VTTVAPPDPARTYAARRWLLTAGALLLAGPVLFDIGYALHPSLPDDSAGALAEVVDVRDQVAVSKVMVAVGGLLIIGLVLTLRRYLVPDRGRILATVGVVLMAIGHAFNALSQATYGYLMFWVSAPDVDPAAGLAVLEQTQTGEGLVTLPVSFWSVPVFAVGTLLFAAALWWANTLPRWVPVGIVLAGIIGGAVATGPVMLAVLALDVASYGTALVVASRRAEAVAR